MPQNHLFQIKLPEIVSLLLAVLAILTPVSHNFAQGTDIDHHDAAANAWLDVKEEYDQSFGSNGCYARQWYMEGYTVGVLAETAIPLAKAGKLGNVKVADLSKASNGDVATKLNVTRSLLDEVPAVKYIPSSNSQASSILARSMLAARSSMQTTLDRWKTLGGDWDPRAHHIVPERFRSSPANQNEADLMVALDDIWQAEGYPEFNINDGKVNGVFLPNYLHPGGHVSGYFDTVRAELADIVSTDPTRAEVIDAIGEIRTSILTDRSASPYKTNTSWDQSGASEFFDAVANTKSVYEN
ncbi:AHH domain-containing protein [Candidatus Woesebacteria bacterium]|nr:AHH domain-containing protein [Candidatus Woesebacteria bacterium]MBP7967271.1 AHH domain-containing protein [Candidatus Woesebacteria bacterium]